jgi:hypothetical protein
VPARTARAPGAVPGRLAGLGALPQHEVEGALLALVDLHARAGLHVVEVALAERAVAGEASDAVVHVAVGGVGEVGREQALDQRDDLRDVVGDPRLDVGAQAVQRVEVLVIRRGVLAGHRVDADALGRRATDDLVLHVGDVADEHHLDARRPQSVRTSTSGTTAARAWPMWLSS